MVQRIPAGRVRLGTYPKRSFVPVIWHVLLIAASLGVLAVVWPFPASGQVRLKTENAMVLNPHPPGAPVFRIADPSPFPERH
jgi:hypothetical protein